MMLNKVISLFLFSIGLLAYPLYGMAGTTPIQNQEQQQVEVGTKTVTLSVPGMTCITCPIVIEKSLENINGVTFVAVDFETKTAIVTFDPGRTNISDLTTATTKAGYPSIPV